MKLIYIFYLIGVLIAACFSKKSPQKNILLEVNNIQISLIAAGNILLALYVVFLAYQEGFLGESIAFYRRTHHNYLYLLWMLIRPIFLDLLIQVFWLKKYRKSILLSLLFAVLLNLSFFSEMRYWQKIQYNFFELTYTYSPPPITGSNQDLLPSSWTYYPSTITLFEVLLTLGGYVLFLGLLYVAIYVLRNKKISE